MTGMKAGAGEDPFADDEETDDAKVDADERREAEGADTEGDGGSTVRIPYKFRRDGVQDGRDRVPLFLHSETKRGEREALRDLEARFDADVSLTDLREALVMVGLDHLDEVESQLGEWGYGLTFDE